MALTRLDKLLADSGRYSRSEARALIRAGRVGADGAVVRQPEARLFEQVIFLLRDDAGAVSDDELLRQANEAAEEYLRPLIPEKKAALWPKLLLLLAGMSLGFGLGVLIGI